MFSKPVIIHCVLFDQTGNNVDEPVQRQHFTLIFIYIENIVRLVYLLSYCDRQNLNLIGGFFIFPFMVTGRGIIFIYSADLTFVVDSMTSNLALISDRHNIKSAPKERNSLRIPHVTVVLRLKFYSFLIIWVMFTFRGCTSSQLANTISQSLNLLFTVKSDASKQTFRTL